MFIGGVIVALLALTMIRDGLGLLSWHGIGIWIAALSMIGARYVNITRYHGLTADGEPATRRDLVRYAAVVLVSSAGVWLAAGLLEGF